jgi:transcriptional regulator with XRE-family HTH domain
MDDVRLGLAFRAVRRRRGWRQVDLAGAAGISQSSVCRLERGRVAALRPDTTRRIAVALGVRLDLEARWRGGELDRLADAEHAKLVERCVRILQIHGWQVEVEFTFSVYGERGSVDIVAWKASVGALLLIEVKTTLLDLQALIATLDRKVRLVPPLLARQRKWQISAVGRLVFAPASTQNRFAMEHHAATFTAAFPSRGGEARRWIRDPAGHLAAIWLARPDVEGSPKRSGGMTRVRVPNPALSRSSAPLVRSGRVDRGPDAAWGHDALAPRAAPGAAPGRAALG